MEEESKKLCMNTPLERGFQQRTNMVIMLSKIRVRVPPPCGRVETALRPALDVL